MTASPRWMRTHSRRGNAVTFSLIAIVIAGGLAFGGWWLFRGGGEEMDADLLVTTVSRGPYDFVVIEQGTVESATNVELRCEVRSRGGGGGDSRSSSGMGGGSVSIIDVIPEGTVVQAGENAVDIGPKTLLLFQEAVNEFIQEHAGQKVIVLQNGVFGALDDTKYQAGTRAFYAELLKLEEAGFKVLVNDGSSTIDNLGTIVPLSMSRFASENFALPKIDGVLPEQPETEEAVQARDAKLLIVGGRIDKNKFEGRRDMLDDLEAAVNHGMVKTVIAGGALGMALKKAEAQLSKKDFCIGTYDNTAHKDYILVERIEQARKILTDGKARNVKFVVPVDFVLPDERVVETIKMADLVLQLDSSALELESETQQTRVNVQQSQVVQSSNGLKAAQIAKTEYLEGTFVSNEKEILSQLFAAQQQLKTARLNLEAAKNLMAKGIATALQVEAAQFGVDDATKKFEVQETKLHTLREYTKAKELTKYDTDIDTAQQKVLLEKNSLQVEEKKLQDVRSQIQKCMIYAPSPGQVVYANQVDSFRGPSSGEFIVTPGAMVRERQILIRLPNATDMQVRATVNEARVTLVRPGLPVTIRVDALKDEVVHGEVIKVNPYAEAGGFSSGNIKRYATLIKILNPPPNLRVGMNSEVRIHVERKQDALQVPVQVLAEVKGKFFSLVKSGDEYVTREVTISSTNDKVATIESGLADGETVVMNPRGAGDLFALPDVPDPTPSKNADIARSLTSPVTLSAANAGGKGGGPEGGGEKGSKGKKGGGPTADTFVDRYLQSDADKDEKLSKEELATMDERMRQNLQTADSDKDGFLDKKELRTAALVAIQRMPKRTPGGGGGGGGPGGGGGGPGGGGGRRGGGEGGGGQIPAGGGE